MEIVACIRLGGSTVNHSEVKGADCVVREAIVKESGNHVLNVQAWRVVTGNYTDYCSSISSTPNEKKRGRSIYIMLYYYVYSQVILHSHDRTAMQYCYLIIICEKRFPLT